MGEMIFGFLARISHQSYSCPLFRLARFLFLIFAAAARSDAFQSPNYLRWTPAGSTGNPTGYHPPVSVMSSSSKQSRDPDEARVAQSVRIISYNVLSSHLASPLHFTECDPQHLHGEKRLPKILQKLTNEIEPKGETSVVTPVIFCLQEVSYEWAGKFHTFFANRNYHFVTGLYGKKFNGYMGIGIAYPLDSYETVAVDIVRLSDTRVGGWPKPPLTGDSSDAGFFRRLFQIGLSALRKTIRFFVVAPTRKLQSFLSKNEKQEVLDHWNYAQSRFNVFLSVILRPKEKKERADGTENQKRRAFCVSNYHMPCAFFAPMVMSIHAEMAARRAQDLAAAAARKEQHAVGTPASKNRIPYVLAGDWNILPQSSTYRLLTTGELRKDDPSYPTPKYGMEWTSTIRGMRSAYAETDHGEPDFTNYAKVRDDPPFIGTLDYIFLSDEWKVSGVRNVVHRDVANGPYPNQVEPSDHVLIAADLQL